MAIRRSKETINPNRIYLGRILKPHALKGELKFQPFGCDPWILESLEHIQLEKPDRTLSIEYVRGSEKAPIVKFASIDSREDSDSLIGAVIWIDPSELPELAEDWVYESDILYSEVRTTEGKRLGRVNEIIQTGEFDVMVIRNEAGKEFLLSANPEVIREVRKKEGLVIVSPPVEEETD